MQRRPTETTLGIHILSVSDDEVFCQSSEPIKCRVVQGSFFRLRRAFCEAIDGSFSHPVDVAYPNPCSKIWLLWFEQLLHSILNPRCHVPELGMIDPVMCSIKHQRKGCEAHFVRRFV